MYLEGQYTALSTNHILTNGTGNSVTIVVQSDKKNANKPPCVPESPGHQTTYLLRRTDSPLEQEAAVAVSCGGGGDDYRDDGEEDGDDGYDYGSMVVVVALVMMILMMKRLEVVASN